MAARELAAVHTLFKNQKSAVAPKKMFQHIITYYISAVEANSLVAAAPFQGKHHNFHWRKYSPLYSLSAVLAFVHSCRWILLKNFFLNGILHLHMLLLKNTLYGLTCFFLGWIKKPDQVICLGSRILHCTVPSKKNSKVYRRLSRAWCQGGQGGSPFKSGMKEEFCFM